MNAPSLYFPHQPQLIPTTIPLEASKSISNRALILDALCQDPCELHNLSGARDTQLMQALLQEQGPIWNAMDAGTTLRFLTAYGALTNQQKQITGTTRMQQRPIGVLVDALREIGADIEYLGETGYPPLDLKGFQSQSNHVIPISGSVSSQYLTALLMMAPVLPQGLILKIQGKLMSRPYVTMTLKLMEQLGVHHQWEKDEITVPHQQYHAARILIESDWSAASYWYSMVGLSSSAEISLTGLVDQSLQGDRQIVEIMEPLGVHTKFTDKGVMLSSAPPQVDHFEYDFSSCPDLAQTVLSFCAVSAISCRVKGLESLRIKETDRIAALQTELAKIGAVLTEEHQSWTLNPSRELPQDPVTFKTYEDHRMAMALAPLALKLPLIIDEPQVVNKSYPDFWKHLAQAGLVSQQHP